MNVMTDADQSVTARSCPINQYSAGKSRSIAPPEHLAILVAAFPAAKRYIDSAFLRAKLRPVWPRVVRQGVHVFA